MSDQASISGWWQGAESEHAMFPLAQE